MKASSNAPSCSGRLFLCEQQERRHISPSTPSIDVGHVRSFAVPLKGKGKAVQVISETSHSETFGFPGRVNVPSYLSGHSKDEQKHE